MAPETKARWRKEVDWLLSVTDYIVELVPSQQQMPDGSMMEVTDLSPLTLTPATPYFRILKNERTFNTLVPWGINNNQKKKKEFLF